MSGSLADDYFGYWWEQTRIWTWRNLPLLFPLLSSWNGRRRTSAAFFMWFIELVIWIAPSGMPFLVTTERRELLFWDDISRKWECLLSWSLFCFADFIPSVLGWSFSGKGIYQKRSTRMPSLGLDLKNLILWWSLHIVRFYEIFLLFASSMLLLPSCISPISQHLSFYIFDFFKDK